jgi:hypothetical protein
LREFYDRGGPIAFETVTEKIASRGMRRRLREFWSSTDSQTPSIFVRYDVVQMICQKVIKLLVLLCKI